MSDEPPIDDTPPDNLPSRIPTSRASGEPPELAELRVAGRAARAREATSSWLVDGASLLHNRFILGGLGVLVVLFLSAIVLIAIGSDGDDTISRPITSSTDIPDGTPVVFLPGLPGEMLATATVRNGPDSTYSAIGTVPGGAIVPVVGRNEDDTWLQVSYPPGSQIRGWVQASLVDVSGDISQLPIAGPGAGPSVDVPAVTESPVIGPFPTEPVALPSATARATRTPLPARTPIPTSTTQPKDTPQPKQTLPPTTATFPPVP